jgi:hypothetical protein
MFQWWKNKRLKRKNRLEKKLKQEIAELSKSLEHQVLLNQIYTKQCETFMVESEQRARKYKRLLEEEKQSNGKLLESRLKEIGKLKEELETCKKQNTNLKENNDLLKNTLGHF